MESGKVIKLQPDAKVNELMTITFGASAVGTSNLTFQNNALCDPTGVECNPIPATWNNGNVVVTSSDTTPPGPPTNVTVQ